jgi:hypothetical protein
VRNPRITINDTVWSQARAAAAGRNTTVSSVVEEALTTYLADRKSAITPNFTGAVTPEDVALTGAEVKIHGVQTVKDPIQGWHEVRPVPKPSKRGR